MTTEQTALLELVRMGATGECLFTQAMYDADWKKLFELAGKQGVACVAWRGIETLYKHEVNCCPVEVKLRWYAATQQATKHYHNHLQAIKTLSSYLAEKGMRMMVLKGYALSLCYPIPSHRPCGDIDIYMFGDYQKCDELLEKNAHIEIDRSQHHHTVFRWNGVMVENHYDFVNQYTHPINRKLEPILKRLAEEGYEEKDGVTLPSPTLSALFVMVHTASHFAAEVVTVRHLADWWLLKKHYGEKVDWVFVKKTCDELGYGKFYGIWEELTAFFFDADVDTDTDSDFDLDVDRLSKEARKVLDEVMCPEFGAKLPENLIAEKWFRLRRWFGSRWKMKLVYQKESLTGQFFMHLRSHWLNPEKMLK